MTASTPKPARTESHRLERAVQRELMRNLDSVSFDSLVIRRVSDDAVCLQGVIHVEDDDQPGAVEAIVRQVAGVDSVLNHLVVQPTAKG